MYVIQHCFIFCTSDSIMTEDARIEPRIVATLALTARHAEHSIDLIHNSAKSHPQTWLDFIHPPFLFSVLLAWRMRPPARRAWPTQLSSP
jgi:hypothetical protein